MKRRAVVIGLAALLVVSVPLLLSMFGVPFDFALSWALIVVVLITVTREAFTDESASWPPPPPSQPVRGSEVARLAWSINSRTGIAGHAVVRRIDRVLRRRLARWGLDPDDPDHHERIDLLVGEDARTLLLRREVRRTDIERVLDALDHLPPRPQETNR